MGKTFLIRQMFAKNQYYFEVIGQKNAKVQIQLQHFAEQLSKTFTDGAKLAVPASWNEAFDELTKYINKISSQKKVILFFDELPWLGHRKSRCLEAIEYYWNKEWSVKGNVKVIVCGSAASWMIDKVINAKGGLHNRLTQSLRIEPFTLKETAKYLKSIGVELPTKQIIDLYMAIGGVPYYLSQFHEKKSVVENIDFLCFSKNGPLVFEFDKLFEALFDSGGVHEKMIRAIGNHHYGIERNELLRKVKLYSGGTFNKRLSELKHSGFITEFTPIDKKKKNSYFRVSDPYCLFYLKWIEPVKEAIENGRIKNYWRKSFTNPGWKSWSGYAFESVCHQHISYIQDELDIADLVVNVGAWRGNGAQIDILIERKDNVMHIIEIKYSENKFSVSKEYAQNLKNKVVSVQSAFKNKLVMLTIVTVNGMNKNTWSEGLVDSDVVLGL